MIKFLLQRPVAVMMAFLLPIIFGVLSYFHIPVSMLPRADIPTLQILIKNPGLAPTEFDEMIVQDFRAGLSQIYGIEDVSSTADARGARITIKLKMGISIDKSFFDAGEKVDEILATSAVGIERPRIIKHNLAEIPSVYLAVYRKSGSGQNLIELSKFTEKTIRRRLEQSEAIAFVDVSGLTEPYVDIAINMKALASLNINPLTVRQTLFDHKFSLGNIEVSRGHLKYTLSLESNVSSLDKLRELPIRTPTGFLPLERLATIQTRSRGDNLYYYNGLRAISLAIVKDFGSHESTFIKSIAEVCSVLQTEDPDLIIVETKNNSTFLNAVLSDLTSSLLWGLVFSIFVTLIFLKSPINTIIIIICVTTSLLLDVLLMYLFGISVNIISISGLILGVGLMIDNIIIVLDHLGQRNSDKNEITGNTAKSIRELITSLISSTLTTCCIFLPLLFFSGLAGVLFFDQAIAVSIAVLSSFAVSIFLLPTVYVLLRKKNTASSDTRLIAIYKSGYKKASGNKVLLVCSLAFTLAVGIVSYIYIPKTLLPKLSENELVFKISWNHAYVDEKIIRNSLAIAQSFRDKIKGSEFYANQQDFITKTQRNDVADYQTLFIIRPNTIDSIESMKASVIKNLKQNYRDADVRFYAEENPLNSILVADEYNVRLLSYNLNLDAQQMQQRLLEVIPTLKTSFIGQQKCLEISLRDARLLHYGIDRNNLLQFIKMQTGTDGFIPFNSGVFQLPVSVSTGSSDLQSILNSQFRNTDGAMYHLKDLLEISEHESKRIVEATAMGRCNVLYIDSDDDVYVLDTIKKIFSGELVSVEGSFQESRALRDDIAKILLTILILLYVILAVQFESLKLPIIILAELPLSIAFVIIVLNATGHTLNIMSFIGIAIMCGVVINDSVLKITLIESLRKSGMSVASALEIAGERRIKAILMTTSITFLAVVPTLFQNDVSSELQSPLILSLIGGLAFGTPITIFVIPVLYKLLSAE